MRCPETCKRPLFLVDPLRFWTLGRLYYNVMNYQVLIERISPYLRCKKILGKAVEKGHLSEMLIHHKVPIKCWYKSELLLLSLNIQYFEPTIDSRFLHKMPKPKCFSSYSQAFFCTFSANSGFPISFSPSIHCFTRKHTIQTSIAAVSRPQSNVPSLSPPVPDNCDEKRGCTKWSYQLSPQSKPPWRGRQFERFDLGVSRTF